MRALQRSTAERRIGKRDLGKALLYPLGRALSSEERVRFD